MEIMKKIFIGIISAIVQAIDTLLCVAHLKRPKIIIYMDGGICSQMLMYLQGQYYAEQGMDVYYDIHWYEVCGKDQYGIMPRTFELTEMWPNIPFKTVSKVQRKWYLLFFQAKRGNVAWLPEPSLVKHSLYFYEYWDLPRDAWKALFAKYYPIGESTKPTRTMEYSLEKTVGVHVRRGDLAKGDNPTYGGVNDGYFLRAIEYCEKQYTPERYVFFSDDPDWVEENICNQIKKPYEVIRGNKAWEDLWLLAQCPIIIGSQGSMGKISAQLNMSATLILCDNKYAKRYRENTIFIN